MVRVSNLAGAGIVDASVLCVADAPMLGFSQEVCFVGSLSCTGNVFVLWLTVTLSQCFALAIHLIELSFWGTPVLCRNSPFKMVPA